ncbi:MAG: iron-containing alcohol dehydrogenase [Mesorhizobium sp.]|nr:MAG: iron-containing alcohol dehydrogenase [Mesorhizobium sp.]
MPHDDSTYTNIKAHPLIDGYARLGIDLVGRYLARRRRRGGCRSAGRDDADLLLRWGVLGPVNTAGGHALAYPLGTRLKLPHGLANAIIFPHVLAFNASACPDKTAGVASMLGLGAGARANDILTSAMELLPGARHRNASVAPWRTGARFADLGRGGLCHKAPDRQQPPAAREPGHSVDLSKRALIDLWACSARRCRPCRLRRVEPALSFGVRMEGSIREVRVARYACQAVAATLRAPSFMQRQTVDQARH